MDPITAIGLASAIITFIEIGSKIAKRLEELSQAGDVPKVFRDIRTRLPLILQIVERTRDSANNLSPQSQVSLETVVRSCYEEVTQLEDILKRVTVGRNDSRWAKGAKAVVSLVEENRVQRIATALKDNVNLLTQLNVSPAEKQQPMGERRSSIFPPSYSSTQTQFHVPFERDEHFVGRKGELDAIMDGLLKQDRVAISGIGGVGLTGVGNPKLRLSLAIDTGSVSEPLSHVFWVWGGNATRFEQGYKRIAQAMEIPGWDHPDANILQLVADWLSTASAPYLLVLDNADNMGDWWPSKYASMVPDSTPSENLSVFLPDCGDKGRMLITTRDSRIASRLARQRKPIPIQPMSKEDSRQLFLSKAEGDLDEYAVEDVDALVHQLDHIPLAISQAAAYIEENPITVPEYLATLESDDAEEALHEELDDTRRDQDSINSIFRTWKLSFDQLRAQKPKAADLLSMISMFDRQSIPKSLLASSDEFKLELITALGTLQSFNLIIQRANKVSFQLHRLVHRFVQSSTRRSGTSERWRAAALKCVATIYPVEIGVAEYELCESLTPHVLALIPHKYADDAANLDLAHLLCWSADFAIEKNQFDLATKRAKQSLDIFQRLVPETDGRRASSTWLYGRLLYYEAKTDEDMDNATRILEDSLRISKTLTMNLAETAFELAHLYFDQNNEALCLKMGKASYECWKGIEGPNSSRALDNLEDYALELAMFGYEEQAIVYWNDILALCHTSPDTSEDTQKVYEFRSLASIAEFSDDAPVAEIFYHKLITLCAAIYNEHHVHVFGYRLCHSEQIFLQDRFDEAVELGREILSSCHHSSEWQIHAGSLQIMAECCRMQQNLVEEETLRIASVELHEKSTTRSRLETMNAIEAYAHCLLRAQKPQAADPLWKEIIALRSRRLGPSHPDTIRAVEYQGICEAALLRDAEAEATFLEALGHQTRADPRLLDNLCTVLWNQKKWDALETRSREAIRLYEAIDSNIDESKLSGVRNAQRALVVALEQQGKTDEALALRTESLEFESLNEGIQDARRVCVVRPLPLRRRFGRMLHPRTWSA